MPSGGDVSEVSVPKYCLLGFGTTLKCHSEPFNHSNTHRHFQRPVFISTQLEIRHLTPLSPVSCKNIVLNSSLVQCKLVSCNKVGVLCSQTKKYS